MRGKTECKTGKEAADQKISNSKGDERSVISEAAPLHRMVGYNLLVISSLWILQPKPVRYGALQAVGSASKLCLTAPEALSQTFAGEQDPEDGSSAHIQQHLRQDRST